MQQRSSTLKASSCRCAGDYRTAQDLVHFLAGFLERYPEYSGRKFWITGESYGAHALRAVALQCLLSTHAV